MVIAFFTLLFGFMIYLITPVFIEQTGNIFAGIITFIKEISLSNGADFSTVQMQLSNIFNNTLETFGTVISNFSMKYGLTGEESYQMLSDTFEEGKSRDDVKEQLERENIFTRKYFYPLISDYECYKDLYDSTETPVAKNISNNVLTLPMYADLSLEDVNMICDLILKK